jgi:hypothetical protein
MSIVDRSRQILEYAKSLETTVQSWADFHNELFSLEFGLVPRLFPLMEERDLFIDSAEYRACMDIQLVVMKRVGVIKGGTPIYTQLPREDWGGNWEAIRCDE